LIVFIRIALSVLAVAAGLGLFVGIMVLQIFSVETPADRAPSFVYALAGVALPACLLVWRDVGRLPARAMALGAAAIAGFLLLVARMHLPPLALAYTDNSILSGYVGGSLTMALMAVPLLIAFKLQTRLAGATAAG
jgi:hypothetical protein